MLPKDYVRYRLTGERATDMADASGTLLLDVAHRRWSSENDGGRKNIRINRDLLSGAPMNRLTSVGECALAEVPPAA